MLVEAFFASSMRTPLIEPLSFEEEWAMVKSNSEAEIRSQSERRSIALKPSGSVPTLTIVTTCPALTLMISPGKRLTSRESSGL